MKTQNYLLICMLFCSCIKTKLLENGRTEAPANTSVFKHRTLGNDVFKLIDTLAVYEELRLTNEGDFIPARLKVNDPNTYYGVYRFYSNGRYNLFYIDWKEEEWSTRDFDPQYHGWRGVMYEKDNQLKGDLFTQIGQLPSQLGVNTYQLIFNGDTLIVDLKKGMRQYFVKRKIESSNLRFYANW